MLRAADGWRPPRPECGRRGVQGPDPLALHYDQTLEYEGFYLDDIHITNVNLPGACVPTRPGENGLSINNAAVTEGNAGTTTAAQVLRALVERPHLGLALEVGPDFRCSSMDSVAMRTASAFDFASGIAQPPMTSLLSEKGRRSR